MLYFYLYLILDLFSRKVVGWEVHEEENAEHASWVIRKASLAEGRGLTPLVLHSDNGSPMKGATMLATLQKLGIAPSFSRPGVSDDNAHAEAFFRTLKYRPGYPSKGFKNLDEARDGSMKFVRGYNTRHQHSALKFVTPAQRPSGHRHRYSGSPQGTLRRGQSRLARALARLDTQRGAPGHRLAQSGTTGE
jgi:transposase InsO family protein